MGRCVVGICRYRTLIGRLGLRKFAEFAFDDAEFIAGHRIVRTVFERRLEGCLCLGQA